MSAHRFTTSELAHIEIYGRMGRAVARLRNLSSTGAFLELQQGEYLPKRGDLVKATIHLHTLGRSRMVDAEVVWNNTTGFGVCFLKKAQLLEKMFQKGASL